VQAYLGCLEQAIKWVIVGLEKKGLHDPKHAPFEGNLSRTG